ncbi:uncharacterized protein LOC135161409 [Diachasmimorpha longicaudata]|uniref:uncharacterized protein LOC135161409 n=1 Tax=Diachasmimorpha longicaudata TaxID=58733 RepID=UPI0030B9108F
MRIINTLAIIISLSASTRHGSCTPTRIILDGNARDLPASALTAWDPWDTYGGLFSPRTPQFDMYRPTIGHLRNFGNYAMGKNGINRLRVEFSNPLRLTPMSETRCENLDEVKKRSVWMPFGLGTGVRCHRTAREWMLQEPLYVKEPGWIPLDVKGDGNEDTGLNEEDPFILARGKRSAEMIRTDLPSVPLANSSREKREVRRSDAVNINDENDESIKSFYRGLEKYLAARSRYLQPRDKHSDIMDILNEPFFISRGKKFKVKKNDFQGITNLEFHGENSPDKHRPIRDRRGEIVEQLLKDQDPFYIARGKKSTSDISGLLQNWKK